MKRKKWLICVLCVAALLEMTPAQGTDITGRLRVGYVKAPKYMTTDETGSYRGYGYEYMQTLANYGNWEIVYVAGTLAEGLQRLENGEIDVFMGLVPESGLNDRVDLSLFPMGMTHRQMFLRGGIAAMDQAVQNREELRLGCLADELPDSVLVHVARKEQFRYRLIPFTYRKTMLEGYDAGQLDGFVTDMLNQFPGTIVENYGQRFFYLAVRKGNQPMLQQLNETTDRMLIDDPMLQQRLYEKFYRYGNASLLLTQEEREYLKDKREIIAVAMADQRPYSYFENGEHKGIFAEIMMRMAADLGVKFKVLKAENYGEAHHLLQEGKADIDMDFFSDYSWGREKGVRLSIPYMHLYYVDVFRRGAALPEEPRVACLRGVYYTRRYIERLHPERQRQYYDTVDECLQAVNDGKADVTYIKGITAQYKLGHGDYKDLVTNGDIVFSYDVSVGVSNQAAPLLRHIFNKEIGHMDPRDIQRICDKESLDMSNSISLREFIYIYPVQTAAAIVIVAVIIISGLLYMTAIRKKHIEAIRRIAQEDMETGLQNIYWFEKELAAWSKNTYKTYDAGCVAVAVLQLGRQNMLAESYGRDFINHCLAGLGREIRNEAGWIKAVATQADSGKLLCLCADSVSAEQLQQRWEELVQRFELFASEGLRIHLGLRAGLCCLSDPNVSANRLISNADTACMMLEGSSGRVGVFDDTLRHRLQLRQTIEDTMEKALTEEAFQVWYQPKYDIRTRLCVGAEVLVRWNHSSLGFLPPGQFIPIFETNGFVLRLDFYMLTQTCRFQRRRLDAGKPVIPISVNQSRLHMSEADYLDKMRRVTEQFMLPSRLIELEVTETTFADFDQADQHQHFMDIITGLQALGYSLSIDDFGSGYSSLALLNSLPMEVMKIDKSLLDAAGGSARAQVILSRVIALGNALHMQVICEGIETREQEELLLRYGCIYGQGYLYARPMPEKEFEAFFDAQIMKNKKTDFMK